MTKCHDFHSKRSRTVTTLATTKKLQDAQSYVHKIMDKLRPVREAMAQKNDNWEGWGLEELVENLRTYTDRTPLPNIHTPSNEVKKPVANQGSHHRRGDNGPSFALKLDCNNFFYVSSIK